MGFPALGSSQHKHAGWGRCSRLHTVSTQYASPKELGTPRVKETKKEKNIHLRNGWQKNEPGGELTLVSEGN